MLIAQQQVPAAFGRGSVYGMDNYVYNWTVMIVDRIKRHNILNGFLFSFVEFALIALLIGGFAIFALMSGKYLIGIVGLGIAANCIPVMAYSIQSLRAKEKALGFGSWLHASGRLIIAKRYSEAAVDTTVIVVATAIPFLALFLMLIDVLNQRVGAE